MGTPNESNWPEVTKLKDFKGTFPKWNQILLEKNCSKLSKEGYDLLSKMLVYDPMERITCEEALEHPFFNSINKAEYPGY